MTPDSLFRTALMGGAAVLFAACVTPNTLSGKESLVFDFSEVSATGSDAQQFAGLMAEERRKVRNWWGATFEAPIRVSVSREHRVSMALVPAWRGQQGDLLIPMRGFAQRNAATLHELIHVYAPNGNRFLAEGLATYGHQLLGGRPAFPNFGRDLHEQARALEAGVDLAALERYATPRPLPEPNGRSYIIAGSFVGFLIERRGMAAFRCLYARSPLVPGVRDAGDTDRWHAVYGRTFDQLADEWRGMLKAGAR